MTDSSDHPGLVVFRVCIYYVGYVVKNFLTSSGLLLILGDYLLKLFLKRLLFCCHLLGRAGSAAASTAAASAALTASTVANGISCGEKYRNSQHQANQQSYKIHISASLSKTGSSERQPLPAGSCDTGVFLFRISVTFNRLSEIVTR